MVLAQLARILAPLQCLVCGRKGPVVCEHCFYQNIQPAPPSCFRCNKNSDRSGVCVACRPQTALTMVQVGGVYDGILRELIQRLKYHRLREASGPLAALATPLLRATDHDVVTAVPVATNRLRIRGYNQSELIARRLAHHLRLPYRTLLRRRRNTQQVGKSRAQRQQEVQGAFVAIPRAAGRRVLIVDDVLTTGATLDACAGALQAVGAAQISAAVTARDI